MHLSSSSYRPVLLSVEGMSGRGRLPVGVASVSLSTGRVDGATVPPGREGTRTGAVAEACSAAG